MSSSARFCNTTGSRSDVLYGFLLILIKKDLTLKSKRGQEYETENQFEWHYFVSTSFSSIEQGFLLKSYQTAHPHPNPPKAIFSKIARLCFLFTSRAALMLILIYRNLSIIQECTLRPNFSNEVSKSLLVKPEFDCN